jgi:hypothetical protein
MSVGPSTSGLGFVFCKAFFQQLAWIPREHGSRLAGTFVPLNRRM